MARNPARTVTIAGAGIAGLTAALCLEKYSIPARLIEKRASLAAEGAGIQITPNAMRILASLGLSDALRTKGRAAESLTVHAGDTGRKIARMPLGATFEREHGAPYLVIGRQALLDILHEAAYRRGIEISFGTPYRATEHDGEDVLVGADGVWSAVRAGVNGAQAAFSGRTAFRAMIPATRAPDWAAACDLSIWLGNDAHFVLYPVDRERTLNLVCVVKSADIENRWSMPAAARDILPYLEKWHPSLKGLVEECETWLRWPLYAVSPRHSWVSGKKALIGDSAHAMVPFLAQGGAMAIEDAAILAHALHETADAQSALAAYRTARHPRVARVWREAEKNGARYHWSGPAALARNLALSAVGGKALLARYRWLYGWRAPGFSEKTQKP